MFRASKPKRGLVTAPLAPVTAPAAPVAQPERAASRRPGQLLEERARKTQLAQRKTPAVDIAGVIDRLTDWQLGGPPFR